MFKIIQSCEVLVLKEETKPGLKFRHLKNRFWVFFLVELDCAINLKNHMFLTPKIDQAISKAALLHAGQKKKTNEVPYVAHSFAVAFILSRYTKDEDIIIAGLLHDVLEDVVDYSFKQIKEDFGKKVGGIVQEVSEDKEPSDSREKNKLTWKKRKEKYLANLENDRFGSLMVCCADKIHNLLSLQQAYKDQGEDIWPRFNATKEDKLSYYENVLQVLKRRLDNEIVTELENIFADVKKIFLGYHVSFRLRQDSGETRQDINSRLA